MVNMDWFTESIPYTLENNVTVQAICEMLNLLYNKIVREENSATYGCYADYYIIRGEKEEYQIGFTADCEMHPEKCDSVLALMKNTFSSMADSIDRTIFSTMMTSYFRLVFAKESLLKSLDELEKTKNGFWLDIIWKKENRGIDLYINRIQHIKQLTPYKIQQFLKHFLKTSHFSATLMEPK